MKVCKIISGLQDMTAIMFPDITLDNHFPVSDNRHVSD